MRPAEQHQQRAKRRAVADDAQAERRARRSRRSTAQYRSAPPNGVAHGGQPSASATSQKRAAYRLRPTYSSQNGAMSQVLITSRPPSASAARPCVQIERSVAPRLMHVRGGDGQHQQLERHGHEVRVQVAQERGEERELVDAVGLQVGDDARGAETTTKPLVGGHTPGVTPSAKCLMPSDVARVGAEHAARDQILEEGRAGCRRTAPAAWPSPRRPPTTAACTPAARARFQASEARPTIASAGTVAAARL